MPKSFWRLAVATGLSIALTCASTQATAQADRTKIPDPQSATLTPPKPASVKGDFTLVSVGDLLYAHPVAGNPDPGLQNLLSLVKAGDVAIGNQEGVFFDPKTFNGHAPGSPYILRGEAALATDLKAMGIDMVSTANNHSNDWDIEGLVAMDKLLDHAGIVHAGDGQTLAQAQAARFLDTPKGRIALIATASTFKQGAKAQDAMDGIPARAGISALRLREINIVTADTLAHLRAADGEPGASGDLIWRVDVPYAQQYEIVYRAGVAPHRSYEMNTFDHDAILKAIRDGKQNADLAVFTIHAHENEDGMEDQAIGRPADFLVQLSHEAVDAGADVVMGGGPHSMRGIEIYKGKPIFYGLAVFLFKGNVVLTQEQQTEHYGPPGPMRADPQNPRASGFHAPASWNDGFVATTRLHNGLLQEVRLYPLIHDQAAATGGERINRLAPPERARKILEQLQTASQVYGTKITIDGSVGVIKP